MLKINQSLLVVVGLTLILVGLVGNFEGVKFVVAVGLPFVALTVMLYQRNVLKESSLIGVLDRVDEVKRDLYVQVRNSQQELKLLTEKVEYLTEKQQEVNTKLTMSGLVKR